MYDFVQDRWSHMELEERSGELRFRPPDDRRSLSKGSCSTFKSDPSTEGACRGSYRLLRSPFPGLFGPLRFFLGGLSPFHFFRRFSGRLDGCRGFNLRRFLFGGGGGRPVTPTPVFPFRYIRRRTRSPESFFGFRFPSSSSIPLRLRVSL